MATAMRYEVRFTGRVQGVFFRATTEEVARDFEVAGFVRNERDGSVRLVAEGDRDVLDRFVAAIRRAKAANIDAVEISRGEPTGEFDGFAIAY